MAKGKLNKIKDLFTIDGIGPVWSLSKLIYKIIGHTLFSATKQQILIWVQTK